MKTIKEQLADKTEKLADFYVDETPRGAEMNEQHCHDSLKAGFNAATTTPWPDCEISYA
jgi:hypothetical protein